MYEAAASCKDISRAAVTDWETQCVTLVGYCAVQYGMKVQLLTPYRVSHLQRYGVTVRGNVTSVYRPLKEIDIATVLPVGRGIISHALQTCIQTGVGDPKGPCS